MCLMFQCFTYLVFYLPLIFIANGTQNVDLKIFPDTAKVNRKFIFFYHIMILKDLQRFSCISVHCIIFMYLHFFYLYLC